jgi:FkbM family methyltransferase
MFRNIVRKLHSKIKSIYSPKKGVLVYIGLQKGSSFDAVFRSYETCYGFEANPELYRKLLRRFRRYTNVHIFNDAVTNQDGEIDFNVSKNKGASSSVGQFKEDWINFKSGDVRMIKTIRIPSINLLNFLEKRGIKYISSYVSDIQGLDLEVLKSLKPLIDRKQISDITCEVSKDEHGNIYKGVPDNSESGFKQLLDENYECIAKGWGVLRDGEFFNVPDASWEMDCKWKPKKEVIS